MASITFKGEPVKTIGNLPEIGKVAPDFKLVRQDLSEASLEDYSGKKKLLNIVASLDTGTCATSAKKFYDKLNDHKDVILINISMDLPFAQSRFCKAENLDHAEALSAYRSSFPEDYGVKMLDGPLKGLCSRAVILLNENNEIVYSEQVAEVTDEPNYEKVLEKLSKI